MRFVYLKNSSRCKEEQWYIQCTMDAWKYLPEERQVQLRELMGSLAESQQEATALFSVLVRGVAPKTAAAVEGVQARRMYELREKFYDRFPI